MKGRKHTPDQIVRKLREGERLIAEGKTVGDVAKVLKISDVAQEALQLLVVVEGVDRRGHDLIRKLRRQSAEYVLRGLPWLPLPVPLLGCRHCCLVRGGRRLAPVPCF